MTTFWLWAEVTQDGSDDLFVLLLWRLKQELKGSLRDSVARVRWRALLANLSRHDANWWVRNDIGALSAFLRDHRLRLRDHNHEVVDRGRRRWRVWVSAWAWSQLLDVGWTLSMIESCRMWVGDVVVAVRASVGVCATWRLLLFGHSIQVVHLGAACRRTPMPHTWRWSEDDLVVLQWPRGNRLLLSCARVLWLDRHNFALRNLFRDAACERLFLGSIDWHSLLLWQWLELGMRGPSCFAWSLEMKIKCACSWENLSVDVFLQFACGALHWRGLVMVVIWRHRLSCLGELLVGLVSRPFWANWLPELALLASNSCS